jgi:hypothetical protein
MTNYTTRRPEERGTRCTVHPLSLEEGHLFLTLEGEKWLVDTGADVSFGRPRRLTLAGETFEVPRDLSLIFASPETLSRDVGVEITGLIGNDILTRFDWVFDVPAGRAICSRDELELEGEVLETHPFAGLPIIDARIGDEEGVRVLFDTGAQIGYIDPERIRRFPRVGTFSDFSPLHTEGRFETPLHDVDVGLGENRYTLKTGVLPGGLLKPLLTLAGADGIVGVETFRHGRAGYFPRRRQLVFERLEGQEEPNVAKAA